MPATAQAGQLLQMSQPGSTSSVATSTYGTTTTLQLGGHPAAALGGGGGGAVVVQPHHHLQLLQQQHQQQQELMGGSPPPQQAQQAQHAQQAQQYITMESSQSSVASAYASVPNSAEHLARGAPVWDTLAFARCLCGCGGKAGALSPPASNTGTETPRQVPAPQAQLPF